MAFILKTVTGFGLIIIFTERQVLGGDARKGLQYLHTGRRFLKLLEKKR